MRAIRTYGSVRGALSNGRSYRDNAVQWNRRKLNPLWRGPKHEFMGLIPAPALEPTLQRLQPSNRVDPRLFNLKPLKQLAGGPPRLGLKPVVQLRRRRHERIRPAPATLGPFLGSTGRAHLAVPPCRSQARQELFQRRRSRCTRLATHRAIGNLHKPLLARPDRVQQLDEAQSGVNRCNMLSRRHRRSWVGYQTLVRRGRRMIPLRDLGAVARLFRQLERGLEEIHEQTQRPIQVSQGGRGFEPLINAGSPPYDGPRRRSSAPPTLGRSCDTAGNG